MKKRSKKFYAWKDKYKRKSRSNQTTHMFHSVPKSYIKDYFTPTYRAQEKQALIKVLKGKLEEEANFPHQHRHSAMWHYW